ncbi:MAG: cation-translocating P-type ATPase [Candidatus Obscuribacterales bacterium]|nr:cation-translocating P-type ATPase [Candidatus Obscuribacterales bacterium]
MTRDEQKLEIDLQLLLPHVDNERDHCIQSLERQLQATRGITQAHIKAQEKQHTLCLHYDPTLLQLTNVQRLASHAGAAISNRYQHQLLPIIGMDCSDCTMVVEHGIKRIDGVLSVSVSYVSNTLKVEFDSFKTNTAEIKERIKGLGYEVPETGLRAVFAERRELIFSLICGLTMAIAWLTPKLSLPMEVAYPFFAAAYIFGGYDIARHAWHSIKERQFDTDLLMVFAAVGAAILGQFSEGALLLFLFSFGHALEELALDKARDAVSKLGQLTPNTAFVVRNTQQIEVSVDEIQIDEIVIVKPGVRIPVDGTVSHGQSSVDQSPITGESVPVEKDKGDKVFAGSINGNGQLLIKVTKLAKDNTLSRVMQLVEESQTQKTKTQQVTEKFTSWFVPAVLVLDLLLIVVPPLLGVPFKTAFLRAMTLLVGVSPCALALGAPSAALAGIAQAARNGVLVKGGVHLETLGQLNAIAFDKTGTLTHGKPKVTDIIVNGSMSENDVLALTAACEARSGHPLASAIVAEAKSRNLSLPEPTELRSIDGRGLVAKIDNHRIVIGNLRLMQSNGIELVPEHTEQLEAVESEGKTSISIAIDGKMAAIIALADTPRNEAKASLAKLRKLGLQHLFLLSGDNIRVASKLATDLGIDQVKAGLMPEDKVEQMKELAANKVVAMVGDGVNDAPALAAASVGIAMGGAATDVALETADVALMGDDLARLPFVISLGRATRTVIQQNLAVSIITILGLASTAVLGLTNIGWAILFHEGSTILVVANSLRLLAHRTLLPSEKAASLK